MSSKSYRDLIVWQKAIELVVVNYKTTEVYPERERYGITHQTRKSAVSLPSNIAEGQGRSSVPDFKRFIAMAKGSLNELETLLIISNRLAYIADADEKDLLNRCSEIARMLNRLSRSLNQELETKN